MPPTQKPLPLPRLAPTMPRLHGELKNLDMPPLTMVFAVHDKALLDRLKRGDKVKFRAVQDPGRSTVVDLQAMP